MESHWQDKNWTTAIQRRRNQHQSKIKFRSTSRTRERIVHARIKDAYEFCKTLSYTFVTTIVDFTFFLINNEIEKYYFRFFVSSIEIRLKKSDFSYWSQRWQMMKESCVILHQEKFPSLYLRKCIFIYDTTRCKYLPKYYSHKNNVDICTVWSLYAIAHVAVSENWFSS